MASTVEQMMREKIKSFVTRYGEISQEEIYKDVPKVDDLEIEIDDIYINLLVEFSVKKARNGQRQNLGVISLKRRKRQSKLPTKLRLQSTSVIAGQDVGIEDGDEYLDEVY
jgi:hypothetical protein